MTSGYDYGGSSTHPSAAPLAHVGPPLPQEPQRPHLLVVVEDHDGQQYAQRRFEVGTSNVQRPRHNSHVREDDEQDL